MIKKIETEKYRITLKNKTEYIVTVDVGDKIKSAWANGIETVSFDNNMIACSMIATIELFRETEEYYLLDQIDDIVKLQPPIETDGSGYKKFRKQYEKLFGRKLKRG